MRQSKSEFFHKGTDTQKRPDFIMDLRRIDIKKIQAWTKEDKALLDLWIIRCRKDFDKFMNEMENI